jgi:hypothetical protein
MFAAQRPRRAYRHPRPAVTAVLLVLALGLLCAASAAALADPQPAPMWLGAALTPVTGESFYVSGGINAADDLTGQSVSIFKREMGEDTDTLLAEVPITHSVFTNEFHATLPGLTHSSILTATWAGNAEYLPSSHWTFVRVRAKVTLTAPRINATYVRLKGTITPSQPQDAPSFFTAKSFLVLFQRRVAGEWTFMGMGDTASSDGQSWVRSTYYGLKPGTYVLRARFVGTDYNAPRISKTLRITVP